MCDQNEETKLTWALRNGDLEEVEAKIKTAEDANRTLDGGSKPLHIAADFGHHQIIEFLISKGADVNAPSKYGLTALLMACYENHYQCVKILLEKGADKNQKGVDGASACEASSSKAIQALFE